MRNQFRAITSMLLAVAMFFSLIPAMPASAATGASFFHFSNLSMAPGSPTPENRSSIVVSGTYSQINPSTISYEIKRFDDTVTGGTGVKPILDEATNTFQFLNVQLNQGDNKIIVSGISTTGERVSATAYVKFSDVPAAYEVALSDGRILEENATNPVIVTTQTISISVKATNGSKGVTVNGQSMYAGGGDTFYSAGLLLQEGVNELVIVVNSESKTQTITRKVVYHPTGGLTVNDLQIGSTRIDGQAVVTGSVNGVISGYIIVDAPPAGAPVVTPELDVELYQVGTAAPLLSNTTSGPNSTITLGQATVLNNSYMYHFTTQSSANITQSGEYFVFIKSGSLDLKKTFQYRDRNAPTIEQVYQLYGVVDDATNKTVTSTSESVFPSGNDTILNELPVYLMVEQKNAGTITIESSKGAGIADIYTYNKTGSPYNGYTVFKITNLPSGQQNLIINAGNASGTSDTRVIPVTFLSSSYIDVYDLYNNQLFKNSTEFNKVTGRVVNYTGNSEFTISLNGNTRDLTVTNGQFAFTDTSFLQLVPGPNTLVIKDKAGKISTKLTLLYFSDTKSIIKNMVPFPVGSATDSDPDGLFRETAKNAFNTYEKALGLRFEVENTDEITVNLSYPTPTMYAVFTRNLGSWTLTGGSLKTQLDAINQADHKLYYNITNGANSSSARVVLKELALPEVGLQAVTIESRYQAVTTTDSIEITRERAPYEVLSPKLPNEGVLKQNFVMVSIKAEGADSILIGKEPMVKSEISDIFRLEVKNLKSGKNTIKFTIQQGSKKTNGSIVVTYTDDATEGSQYKTNISKSGKVKVFKGGLSLSLPKGTVLQQSDSSPNAEVPTINLLGEHDIMFGIANPIDGRTIKAYNRIGEIENGVEMDGRLALIPGKNELAARLFPKPHFGYSSPLYWLDAGSLNADTLEPVNDFLVKPATHPYAQGSDFVLQRMMPKNWMETSLKGTITLQYDSGIVNAAASNLGIWWYNPSQGEWTNIGGKVDAKKKTVTATFKGFGYYVVKSLRYSYSDAISHKTARNDIELMLARGYMKASKTDAFGIYDPMTRGEFATIIVKLLDIELDYDTDKSKLTFDDIYQENVINSMLWDYRYIETAARKGIIRGIAPRSFAPNMELTREEAASIIARAMNLKMGEVDKDKAALQKQFEDVGKIKSNYSYPAILAVTKAGIITGVANSLKEGEKKPTYNFNPDAVLNRADMATIVKRMMSKLKLL
ncbi:S-layer protein [Paenibacillus solani]|uniref:S-layer protein n=1 Tax=Paenibacillus solani TaxID=1705565 RepID=A0A0M1N288_9BACL|nr:S-layer protein [Paenibacillus solani]